MILIISESNDVTTSAVMEWLHASGQTVLRINECDRISHCTLSNSGVTISIAKLNGSSYTAPLTQFTANWYRKGGLNFNTWLEQQIETAHIDRYIKDELRIIADYMHYLLTQGNHLGSSFSSRLNKLFVNHLANSVGLQTPAYIISSDTNALRRFLHTHPQSITKAISENFYIRADDSFIISYTEPVQEADLGIYPLHIKPSLLQQRIEKKYELRIFYLNGKCYSAAIFSQGDDQTKVDFRKYNWSKPNRTVPFSLPPDIEKKIHRLMQQLHLNTGSIDMIVSKDNEYIFLEINPVGQFGMVSYPCNYYLEKKVASFLAAQAN
jgi:ATP-GRASP peptide maturase of grasp-with-spasm system